MGTRVKNSRLSLGFIIISSETDQRALPRSHGTGQPDEATFWIRHELQIRSIKPFVLLRKVKEA